MSAGMDLGIGLVIAGLVFGTLVWAVLRLFPSYASAGQIENIPLILPDVNQASEAVLVIQAGGRVEFINPARATGLASGKMMWRMSNVWHAVCVRRKSFWMYALPPVKSASI